MRKLKRKLKPNVQIDMNNTKKSQNLVKLEKIKKKNLKNSEEKNKSIFGGQLAPIKTVNRYPKQQCAFVYPNGERCKKYAVGKSSLCKTHGGDRVIRENLLVGREENISSLAVQKFDITYHPFAYLELAKTGKSDVEIAAEFKISPKTLIDWSEKYDTFNTVWEIGQAMYEAWWLEKGKENLDNKRNFNSSLFKYITMNKLGWSDKVEQKSFNTNIHGVLLAPDPVSDEEWEEVIDVG